MFVFHVISLRSCFIYPADIESPLYELLCLDIGMNNYRLSCIDYFVHHEFARFFSLSNVTTKVILQQAYSAQQSVFKEIKHLQLSNL